MTKLGLDKSPDNREIRIIEARIIKLQLYRLDQIKIDFLSLVKIPKSSFSEPKALASIFLKRKPVPPKPEAEEQLPTMPGDSVLSSTVSSVVTLDNATNICGTSDLDSSPRKAKSAAEQEAANRAFKALFTGAFSQKMLPTATAAEALPAPWPLVSHVIQRDEDVSCGVNFWSIPWPVGKYNKSDDFSHNLSLDGKFHLRLSIFYSVCSTAQISESHTFVVC